MARPKKMQTGMMVELAQPRLGEKEWVALLGYAGLRRRADIRRLLLWRTGRAGLDEPCGASV